MGDGRNRGQREILELLKMSANEVGYCDTMGKVTHERSVTGVGSHLGLSIELVTLLDVNLALQEYMPCLYKQMIPLVRNYQEANYLIVLSPPVHSFLIF